MTAALADFVTSPQGRFYGHVCKTFGVDPGAPFSDDVVAFQMRAALLAAEIDEPEPEPEPFAEFR